MLPIFNDDATALPFKQAIIPGGEVIIWQEILSEGPLVEHASPVGFWQARQHYIAHTYQQEAITYILKVTADEFLYALLASAVPHFRNQLLLFAYWLVPQFAAGILIIQKLTALSVWLFK